MRVWKMWVIYRYYVQADDQWQHFFQFLRTTQQVLHFLDNWERDYKFLSSTYILPKGSIERREVMLFIEKWLGFTEYWTICNFTKNGHFSTSTIFFFCIILKQVFWKWASWFCSSVLFQNEKMTFRNMILICFIFGHFRHSSN